MRPPVLIDDPIFNDRVAKLVAVGGKLEATDLTLEDIADMIHTRRMRINPLGEPDAPKPPKAKKTKITGNDMDSLVG